MENNLSDIYLLKQFLYSKVDTLNFDEKEKLLGKLQNLLSVYPFNEFEYIVSHLLAYNSINIDGYLEMREQYLNQNPFLFVFEMSSPTSFGISWAQTHLKTAIPELQKPTKTQYDFLLDEKIRVELKASRFVDFNSDRPLFEKGLSAESNIDFDMNFQQIKPACCDVFVLLGAYTNRLKYWVMSAKELSSNKIYSDHQHFGNTGEGQFHINEKNISMLDLYLFDQKDLLKAIREASKRN
jgi:hypothetical protein